MTEQNSFTSATDQNTETNTSNAAEGEVDKKSLEGQLSIVQKRLDDQLSFIETLKQENKELRDQASASSKVEELLNKIDASQIENGGQQQQQTSTSPVSTEDLREQGFLTKQDLENERLESMYKENFDKVESAMIDTYGQEKYLEVVSAKAKELGMSVQDVDALARSNPNAALKLLEAKEGKAPTGGSTTSSLNTQAIDTYNKQHSSETPKSVMFGATTKQMTDAWRHAGNVVKQQMEQGNA